MEELKIDLFEPGMGPLHRAGLGGLAATVSWLKDHEGEGPLASIGEASFDARTVTLSWGKPEGAAAFLRKLYEASFGLRDGMIDLPGSRGGADPPSPVRASLQAGLLQTFLQHGKSRKAEGMVPSEYDDGDKRVPFQYQKIGGYAHQSAYQDLVDEKSGRIRDVVAVKGMIAPGSMVRHEAFNRFSILQVPPGHAIALHFALIGTLSLPLGPKGAALIVPDVENLVDFADRRSVATPKKPVDCQAGGLADAALRAMVHLHAHGKRRSMGVERCQAVLFKSPAWSSQQKTRAAVLDVEIGDRDLARFRFAMGCFQPRLASAKPDKKGGQPVAFWAKSVVLPLVAENLARGRPWFENFRDLVVGADGKADETRARNLGYEREGLKTMIDEPWKDQGEERLVQAVHEAMRMRFGEIWGEKGVGKDAKKNRSNRQRQLWRLALAGAKTPDDVRNALADMWSRSTPNAVLKADWTSILPLLCDDRRWKLNRDLALLALASYAGREEDEQSGAESGDGEDGK